MLLLWPRRRISNNNQARGLLLYFGEQVACKGGHMRELSWCLVACSMLDGHALCHLGWESE
jgi:hypothetical protein